MRSSLCLRRLNHVPRSAPTSLWDLPFISTSDVVSLFQHALGPIFKHNWEEAWKDKYDMTPVKKVMKTGTTAVKKVKEERSRRNSNSTSTWAHSEYVPAW